MVTDLQKYLRDKQLLSKLNERGYSLVEMVVVVVIMAILFSVGFGNYRSYQKRQYIEGAVRMLKADLRLAQENALAGRKPLEPPGNSCLTNSLNGYVFRLETNATYAIYARCAGIDILIKGIESLPSGILVNPWPLVGGNDILFQILGKGVNRSTDVTINLTWPAGGVSNKQVIVTKGGEIK